MFIGIDIEGDALRAKLGAIPGQLRLGKSGLQELADAAVHRIIRRTEKGRDYRDRPLKPYSASYLRFRTARGRRGKNAGRGNRSGLAPDRVTLTFRGEMLAAMTGAAGNGVARVYFMSRNSGRIANYHNSKEPRKKIPQRRFMDLSRGTSDYRALAQLAARLLGEQVKRGWS